MSQAHISKYIESTCARTYALNYTHIQCVSDAARLVVRRGALCPAGRRRQ